MSSSVAFESASPEETEALGERLGRTARPNAFVALLGELGAGKTTLVRGLARGLGSRDRVQSPSFTLHGVYEAGRLVMHHLDAYFRERMLGLLDEGLADEFFAGGVTAVEWAEEIADHLPGDRLEITLEHVGEERRRIVLRSWGPASDTWLRRLREDAGAP